MAVVPASSRGASSTGATTLHGPFAFAYNTAGILAGLTVYTPTAGDWLLDAWIDVTVAFNGTTPFADIGNFNNGTSKGLFAQYVSGASGVDLSGAGNVVTGSAHLRSISNNGSRVIPSLDSVQASAAFTSSGSQSAYFPVQFITADPLLLCVSTTGKTGGSAIGGSAGAASLYLLVLAAPAGS